MFDALVRPAPRRRLRTLLIGTSLVVHGVVAFGLIVAGMWKIEKVESVRTPVSLAAVVVPGDSGGGGAPRPATPLRAKTPPPKVIPRDTIQPVAKVETEVKPVVEAADVVALDGTGLGSDVPGNGTGGDGRGRLPPIGSGCTGDDCGTGTGTDTRKVKPPCEGDACAPRKRVTVAPNIASGLRISGNDQIVAPDAVRLTMMHEGKQQVTAAVLLCIDTAGRVDQASVKRSTGYPEYDAKLLREMRSWRYRAYEVDGKATPACTSVVLVYRITQR